LPLFAVVASLAALLSSPDPATAQFGLDKAFKKVLKVPKILDPGGGGGSQRSGGSGSDGSSSDRNSDSPTSNKEVKAEIDRLEQARLQRDIALNNKERDEVLRTAHLERQRNVEQAVKEFLNCLKGLHGITDEGGLCVVARADRLGKASEISQVTAGELTREAEEAYKAARLYDFERLAGELWTRERLIVRIIDRSRLELPPYFQGVGAKGPSMEDLKKVFARVAREVYSRALEVSEVAGVSQSFDRFIRTIYEKSGKSNLHLWTDGADGRYERFVTAALGAVPREKFVKENASQAADPLGLERQFKFRFRARRVIFDCLSTNYTSLVGSGKPAAQLEVGHIETGSSNEAALQEAVWQKAQDFVQTSCRDGIEGVSKLVVADRIKPESARWISAKAVPAVTPAAGEQGQAELAPLKNEDGEPSSKGADLNPQ
jgi:hypothetical protein